MALQVSEVILNFVEGENEGVEIRVGNKLPRTLTLGRSEECDIFLGEKKISRKHCQIVVQPNRVFLKDLQSTNGTFVNKERVENECDLHSDDRVQVGTTVIRLTIEEAIKAANPPETQNTVKMRDVVSDLEELPTGEALSDELFPGVSRSAPVSLAKAPSATAKDERVTVGGAAPRTLVMPPDLLEELPSLDEDEAELLETVPKRKEPESQRPLSGDLSAMGLADLLQSLAQNHKSGHLTLAGIQKGELTLREGQLVHATLGDVDGPKALYRMLAWNEGEFEFSPLSSQSKSGVMKASITGKIETLLMEGFRQHDEYQKLKSRLPDESSALLIKPLLRSKLSELHPKVLDVLQAVWNEKNFQRVLDKSPFSDLETAKMIYYLLKKDYIVAQ